MIKRDKGINCYVGDSKKKKKKNTGKDSMERRNKKIKTKTKPTYIQTKQGAKRKKEKIPTQT